MKKKHYGKELVKFMNRNGVKKIFLCKYLQVSRPTMDARIKDGNFSELQKLVILNLLKHEF